MLYLNPPFFGDLGLHRVPSFCFVPGLGEGKHSLKSEELSTYCGRGGVSVGYINAYYFMLLLLGLNSTNESESKRFAANQIVITSVEGWRNYLYCWH